MGLGASSCRDNDDLIDKLVEGKLVTSKSVELIMRLVDRSLFFPNDSKSFAYKDVAWKSVAGSPGHLHISAPCIYANVLEHLELEKGLSFLNVGSGTGYLNTVVGFFLGSNGLNHGIELHPNIVEFARARVFDFLIRPEVQCYDWAIPSYSSGNGLMLHPIYNCKYDRVYCGASVPESHRESLWDLLKVGGVLVMPFDDQLQQVRRNTDKFEVKIISTVSFSRFILPTDEEVSSRWFSHPPAKHIPALQFLSTVAIRKLIRENIKNRQQIRMRSVIGDSPVPDRRGRPSLVVIRGGELNGPPPFIAVLQNTHMPRRLVERHLRQLYAYDQRLGHRENGGGEGRGREDRDRHDTRSYDRDYRKNNVLNQISTLPSGIEPQLEGEEGNIGEVNIGSVSSLETSKTKCGVIDTHDNNINDKGESLCVAEEIGNEECSIDSVVSMPSSYKSDDQNKNNSEKNTSVETILYSSGSENTHNSYDKNFDIVTKGVGYNTKNDEDSSNSFDSSHMDDAISRSRKRMRHSSDGKSLVVKRAKDSFDDISHSSDAEMSSNTGLISSGISLNILQHPSEDSDSQATHILEETNNNDGVDNTHEETDREGGMSASTDEEDDENMRLEQEDVIRHQFNGCLLATNSSVSDDIPRDESLLSFSSEASDDERDISTPETENAEEEKERRESCNRQKADIEEFAAEFNRLIDDLPLSKGLKTFVKHFT